MERRRTHCVDLLIRGSALPIHEAIGLLGGAMREARMHGFGHATVIYEIAGVDGPENFAVQLPVGMGDGGSVDMHADAAIQALRRVLEMRLDAMPKHEMRGVRRIKLIE
jgi:hypothetical protein